MHARTQERVAHASRIRPHLPSPGPSHMSDVRRCLPPGLRMLLLVASGTNFCSGPGPAGPCPLPASRPPQGGRRTLLSSLSVSAGTPAVLHVGTTSSSRSRNGVLGLTPPEGDGVPVARDASIPAICHRAEPTAKTHVLRGGQIEGGALVTGRQEPEKGRKLLEVTPRCMA